MCKNIKGKMNISVPACTRIEYFWKTTEKLVVSAIPWERTGWLGIGLGRKSFKVFTFSFL